MSLPQSWAEIYDRFAQQFGNDQDGPEWLRQALRAKWSADTIQALPRPQRGLALQKASGALLWIEDNAPTDLAFMVGLRGFVQEGFAVYFDGHQLPGPPWMLDPTENMPPYRVWLAQAAQLF